MLQAQLDWPVSMLALLYSAVVPHAWQAESPRAE
jgi:hypothetical protein